MNVKQITWDGLRPRSEPRLLDPTWAQIATDCNLLDGALKPIRQSSVVASGLPVDQISLFRYDRLNTFEWLTWATDVDVVQAAIPDDLYERIFWTGDGAPKVRGIDPDTNLPVSYDLGIPKPATAAVATVEARNTAGWTRIWGYQYENQANVSSGYITQRGTLVEGSNPTDIAVDNAQAGKHYSLAQLPTKTSAGVADTFILFFDAYDANGVRLGRLYPRTSLFWQSSDFFLDGAKVGAKQTVDETTGADMTLDYTTFRTQDYAVYRSWVYTYVDLWDDEGPPSDPTEIVGVDPTQQTAITGLPTTAPAGYPNVKGFKLYRSVTAQDGTSQYQLVTSGTFPGTGTYTDAKKDNELTATMVSTGWFPPIATLKGMCYMPGGFLAAFDGKTVYFSEPGAPHAWPDYGVAVQYDVIGIKVAGNALIVGTKGKFYAMVGNAPNEIQVIELYNQGCTSKRGMVSKSGVVVAPTTNGLLACTAGQATLITEQYFTFDDWNALGPSSMIADIHDNRIHAWMTSYSLLMDLSQLRPSVTTSSQSPAGLWADTYTDTLYMIVGTQILSWATGAAYLTATWRGKKWQFPRPVSPSTYRIIADSYPQTMRLYSQGVLVHTESVKTDEACRLPVLRNEKEWEIELITNDKVVECIVANSMGDIVNG